MNGPPRHRDLGLAGDPTFIRGVAGFLIVAGLGLAALRYFGGLSGERGAEGVAGALALGSIVMATGVLALLGLRERPVLLLPAAIFLVPMSFLSFALVTLPLLVPAVMLFIGYRRRSRGSGVSAGRTIVVLVGVVLLLLAAGVALLAHQDPRQYVSGNTLSSTSDIITWFEAGLGLALVGAALAFGWVVASPDSLGYGRTAKPLSEVVAPSRSSSDGSRASST